jgi:tyrosine-protein kinase Etk/Wzc
MSEQVATKLAPGPDARIEEDINLLDLAVTLAKHKKRIVAITFGAAVLAAGISLIMPNIFTASTKVLPPQQPQSGAAAMLGQLGSLGGLAGGSLGIKNPSEMYIGMLGSRRVGDSIIDQFKLQSVYKTKLASDTRNALKGASTFSAGKDGMIDIMVDDEDPKLAAAIANAYVSELQKLMQTMAVTDASQRRLFFEKQLLLAKKNLADAEVALKQVQEKTGLIRLEGQAEMIISAAAGLKAQIASKEVQMGAMRSFATENNPEFMRIQQELSGLRAQLGKLETGLNQGSGNISIATSKVPEVGLEYVRKVRDVKYNEAIFELLAKQFEIAKIDEAKESTVIQVLDRAIEPDRKSKPKRSLMVIFAAAAAALLSIFWVLIKEAVGGARANADPRELERMALLRRHLRWKST